jgi:hypothetical protein
MEAIRRRDKEEDMKYEIDTFEEMYSKLDE